VDASSIILHDVWAIARNTVLFAGFQVAGTRGRKLIDGASSVRMFGQDWPVRARVVNLRGFSAHADRDHLLRWAEQLGRVPLATYVVHGETQAADSLRDLLKTRLGHRASVPTIGQTVMLDG
jgi:metallo-beta-lactamase family protein